MLQVSSLETVLIWAGICAVAAGVGWWLTGAAARRAPAMTAGSHTGASLDGAVDLLKNAVAEQNEQAAQRDRAFAALDAMEDSVLPPQAIGAVRRLLPVVSPGALHQLLVERWRVTKRKPVLAAIAGLSHDAANGAVSGLGLYEAWDNADAHLLGYLAGFVETNFDGLDGWFGTVSALFLVEAAAGRVAGENEALAARLRTLALRIEPRARAMLMQHIERAIARYFEDVSQEETAFRPRDLALGLSFLCVPRFPELIGAGHDLFRRHAGVDWQLAALVLDLHVIEEFGPGDRLARFDFEQSRQRFYEALIAHDEGLSDDAAFLLVELMEQGYFCDGYALALFKEAMDWTANLHWPRPDGHVRLLDVLAKTSKAHP